MATVKVKLRPSTIEGKAGTIYYRITHRRIIRQITTNMHILPEYWNAEQQRLVASASDSLTLQSRIDRDLLLLQSVIKALEASGSEYTADDVATQYRIDRNRVFVLAFMQEQIDCMRRCNRYGTAKNYEHTMRSFSQFLGGDIPLAAISEPLIDNYNAFLAQRGIVRNSVSFYMRILRAVYNKAVRRHLVEQTNPFQNVYTGIDKTRKRAVDEKQIAKLYKLDLPSGSPAELARDIFIFSYCARGMSFVDIAFLKKKHIQNDVIHYSRHKTGQLLSVKIEPNMKQIIDKYAASVKDRCYVFPILTSSETNEAYNQYRKNINRYNRQLKKLSRSLSLPSPITSYTARHSWANAARKHNAPISIISAGLGHTSEKTTQIYLTSLENSAIDTVNKGIISELCKRTLRKKSY